VLPTPAWLVPEEDWLNAYAVPYFDAEEAQELLAQLERHGYAAGRYGDRGEVVLQGPAIQGVYAVGPQCGLLCGRDAEPVWPVGGRRWPWREKPDVAVVPPCRWPEGRPTPSTLHVVRTPDRWCCELVARHGRDDAGVIVATGLSPADAERLALLWNHTLVLDGIALAGGLLGRLVNDTVGLGG
jgi:hypothetical protein